MAKQRQRPVRQESVFREAWQTMNRDLNRVLPEKMRSRPGKQRFVLWAFLLELLALGLLGGGLWHWWSG
ncbi:hypothetical protein JCM30471_03870 [Desulfuromonas carbonis]